eukprot:c32373_g1_i1.p1 GENE.c32373_g1_i1~~c32373_g1_i1.p1  ORF type:complete len:763 (-),score=162.58 c32373_g1_i1:84-2372(-)
MGVIAEYSFTKMLSPTHAHLPHLPDVLKTKARTLRASKWARLEQLIRTHPAYTVLIIVVTLFAVFGDDIRIVFLPKSADQVFTDIFYFCFAVFVIDMGLSAIFEPRYLRSIIFLLDFLATSSLLLQPLIQTDISTQGLAIARVARIVRIMRIMRIARFAMVSQEQALQGAEKKRVDMNRRVSQTTMVRKSARTARGSSQTSENLERTTSRARSLSRAAVQRVSVLGSISSNSTVLSPSTTTKRGMLGTKLMQLTTEKIIVLVLLLVLGTQLLKPSTADHSMGIGLSILDNSFPVLLADDCFNNASTAAPSPFCLQTGCCQDFHNLVASYVESVGNGALKAKLKVLQIRGVTFLSLPTTTVRQSDLVDETLRRSLVTFDLSDFSQDDAKWSLLLATLVLIVLLVFPYVFGKDVLNLVVTPLEMIYDLVQMMTIDPFQDIDMSLTKSKCQELELIKGSLHRLTKLLQVGLGQASAEIIRRNLKSGSFSALQAGIRIEAIFCFIDIRCFSDYCDVLQEECVTFVNTIAAIVADAVRQHNGIINKNIGEAFLLAWKWGENEPLEDSSDAAEACLQASVAIIKEVARSPKVQAYAKRSAIRRRLGDSASVSVGIGLNIGWAIEGAVGSEQKIDATYLSPTVNTTARLESGTRQYGVSLLMSETFFFELASSRDRCRRIDRVAVKGSQEPVLLVTYVLSGDARELILQSDKYYESYIKGDWSTCKLQLDEFLSRWPNDGPALVIAEFIENHHCVAPPNWEGFRKLGRK